MPGHGAQVLQGPAMRPTGSGIAWWTPTDTYLAADEIALLPETRWHGNGRCLRCGEPPCGPTFLLEGAHALRKQMGGRRKAGPTVELCRECHQGTKGIDRVGNFALAIRRDTLTPVIIERTETGEVMEHELRWHG